MIKTRSILILSIFVSSLGLFQTSSAEPKRSYFGWSKAQEHYIGAKDHNAYLENSRHIQIAQWAHESWYAEDWTSQKDGMSLIKGFYSADILRDQVSKEGKIPVLVVGPNFYRLSGYDKRRVAHVIDVTYGITSSKHNGSFLLKDWYSHYPIGVFDGNGLRLH